MLIDFMDGTTITKIPYASEYNLMVRRLTPAELDAMKAELNTMIDADEIHTAGWMPGSDWSSTPFQPLYEKAALRNYDLSAKMFGLLVWVVFMERPERWSSGRFEKDGVDIGSRTYFRLKP